LNIVPVSSPIASKIPHVAGSAYAQKLKKDKAISVAYFGEGATSEGDFHAGVNFAAVTKAPAIFFCRNNGYAISTPSTMQFASDGIAPKGVGYGILALRCDGNDFFAVHETVSRARAHALQGKGPVIVEAMTYRLGAHSTSDDPTGYRTREEEDSWWARCPIKRLRLYLEEQGLWSEKKEETLKEGLKQEVDEAVAKAKVTPPPPMHSMIEDVYFEVPQALKEQLAEVERVYVGEEGHGRQEHDSSSQQHATSGV
jgi:2-oxoisovalerate dehydrogenase E1 component alpha subunit